MNPKRKLIISMLIISVIAVSIAVTFYQAENKTVDSRVLPALECYSKYDSYALVNDFTSVLNLLDSVEMIYLSIPHYINSYEINVVQNNKAAVVLTIALFGDTLETKEIPKYLDSLSFDSLLNIAEVYCVSAITGYSAWKFRYGDLEENELRNEIEKDFFIGLGKDILENENLKEKMLDKRVKELMLAQTEIDRRLSVVLTNLGVIYRHRQDFEKAADYYSQALEYWSENLDAENNLQILLNKPIRKRNFIEKLFPPEREEN